MSLNVCCTKSKIPDDYYKEKVLAKTMDSSGRVVKRVVAGRIAGEDTYLTITKYDTLGRVMEEYGARPYGTKYKITSKYDTSGRVSERWYYTFPDVEHDAFENYKSDRLYEITDTLAEFRGVVNEKTVLEYDDGKDLIIERHYVLVQDSVTSRENFEVQRIDTVAREQGTK